MPIPVGLAVASFIMTMTGDSEEMVCTLGIDPDGAINDGRALEALEAWQNNILPIQHEEMHLVRVELVDGNAVHAQATPAAPTAGSVSGTGIPPNTALLVRKRTLGAGAGSAGRMYVPGASTSEVSTAGFLNLTFQGDVTAAFATFLADMQLASLQPVVIASDGSGWNEITSFLCQDRVATQRRRLRP